MAIQKMHVNDNLGGKNKTEILFNFDSSFTVYFLFNLCFARLDAEELGYSLITL